MLVGAEETPGRPVLEGYSLALVDQLVTIVAASTVIAYSLYTFTARDSNAMMATVPFVVYGVFRYLLLLHRHGLGEEPENVLLTDVPLLLTIAAWADDLRRHPGRDLIRRARGFADAVDGGAGRLERLFDAAQPLVDRTPARVDQVDEQAEIVDARASLGEQLRLDPLQPPDRLVREPAHLGELAGDRPGLDPDPLADGVADLARQRCLELCGGGRERLDLGAGPLERGLDVGRRGLAGRRLGEPFAGAVESVFVHERDDSVSAG